MISYFDTSALLKLLLPDEEGADLAAVLWGTADGVVTSRVAYPEGRAGLASAARSNRLPGGRLRRAAVGLDEVFGELDVVELDRQIGEIAGEAAERLELRGADAVHLASALAIMSPSPEGIFVTWDRDLARAAVAVGLAVAPALDG